MKRKKFGKYKLKNEGEFLNGKKWNIKEYDKNGNIINELKNGNGYMNAYNEFDIKTFEGEYSNGLKNGKGKKYNNKGELVFEGVFLNDLRHGKGKIYYPNCLIHYEGEYLYGIKWNFKEYDKNNNIINVLKEGKGYIKNYKEFNILFECEYINGLANGYGKEYYNDGTLKFEGEYLNGYKTGTGKIYSRNGNLTFQGEFLYDQEIKGKRYINGKLEYEGEFLYNNKYNEKDMMKKVIYYMN